MPLIFNSKDGESVVSGEGACSVSKLHVSRFVSVSKLPVSRLLSVWYNCNIYVLVASFQVCLLRQCCQLPGYYQFGVTVVPVAMLQVSRLLLVRCDCSPCIHFAFSFYYQFGVTVVLVSMLQVSRLLSQFGGHSGGHTWAAG